MQSYQFVPGAFRRDAMRVAPGDVCGVGSFQLDLVLEERRDCQCVLRQKQSRAPAQGICPKDGLVASEVSLRLAGEQYDSQRTTSSFVPEVRMWTALPHHLRQALKSVQRDRDEVV